MKRDARQPEAIISFRVIALVLLSLCALTALAQPNGKGLAAGDTDIPTLKKSLRDPNPAMRARALNALSRMQHIPEDALPDFIHVVISDGKQFYFLLPRLEKVGPAAGPPLRAEWPNSGNAKSHVIDLLVKVDPSTATVKFLIDATYDPETQIQYAAIDALGRLGPIAESAIPRLIELLEWAANTPFPEYLQRALGVQSEACVSLAQIGPKAIPPLIAEIRRGIPWDTVLARSGPSDAIAGIGAPAVSDLIQVVKDGKPFARTAAVMALSSIRLNKPDAAPLLKGTLPGARTALREALKSNDPDMRAEAIESLWFLGNPQVEDFRSFRKMLSDPEPVVRRKAARFLGYAYRVYKASLPSLIDAVEDSSAPVRFAAMEALGMTKEPQVVKLLTKKLRTDLATRSEAILALGFMGPTAAPAVPDLVDLLDDHAARLDAITALGRIGPGASAAVPRLTRFLTETETSACNESGTFLNQIPIGTCALYAVTTLGEIGPDAISAAPVLTEILEKRHGDGLYTPPNEWPKFSPKPGQWTQDIAQQYLTTALERIQRPPARCTKGNSQSTERNYVDTDGVAFKSRDGACFSAQDAGLVSDKPFSGYRLQASGFRTFDKILFDKVFDPNLLRLDLTKERLPPGTYWFRISEFELTGKEGPFLAPRLYYIAAP